MLYRASYHHMYHFFRYSMHYFILLRFFSDAICFIYADADAIGKHSYCKRKHQYKYQTYLERVSFKFLELRAEIVLRNVM